MSDRLLEELRRAKRALADAEVRIAELEAEREEGRAPDHVLTTAECAKWLGVTRDWLTGQARTGRLPAVRGPKGAWLWDREEVWARLQAEAAITDTATPSPAWPGVEESRQDDKVGDRNLPQNRRAPQGAHDRDVPADGEDAREVAHAPARRDAARGTSRARPPQDGDPDGRRAGPRRPASAYRGRLGGGVDGAQETPPQADRGA